jgi:hypothetical protein
MFIQFSIVALLAAYLLFIYWYGGKGRPLQDAEIQDFYLRIHRLPLTTEDHAILAQLRPMLEQDDGREFIMQNLVRYRKRAQYPEGYTYDENPIAADHRYGKLVIPYMLKRASHPIFISKRSGNFVEPGSSEHWHMVAMVRYRSRRDFMRFALDISGKDIAIHKWAAIEVTQIFPTVAIFSLVPVRLTLALLVLACALILISFS